MQFQLRPPQQVMRLARMGARFQTRLSFMRSVLRRLREESWRIEQTYQHWDDNGYGTAVYRAAGPERSYSLIAFSDYLDASERSDRVIAEKWDAAFTLFDGEPTRADIERLRGEVPRQEAGRCSSREITLSRANKSVRLFEHVVERLAAGEQPDPDLVAGTGYLMRTTAVYGNGKFGLGDRDRVCERTEMKAPYQAELLTVYLIRCFTHDLVDHVARARGGERAVRLGDDARRFLGIGNSTGLGMAPFLFHHPLLLNNWVVAIETAIATVRGIAKATTDERDTFVALLDRAQLLAEQWSVDDERQMTRIHELRTDLATLREHMNSPNLFDGDHPWNAIYEWCEQHLGVEAQELVVTLLIEIYPARVDHLADEMASYDALAVQPGMSAGELLELIEQNYDWALDIDFDDPKAQRYFWYVSEEKLEPRLGERHSENGAEREHALTAARDVCALRDDLREVPDSTTVAEFLLARPRHRHIVRRVQSLARFPYAEIRDNLLGEDLLAIDMLRFKLSVFGATKFDPRSDKWTRINMYQGAPLPHELDQPDSDRWMFLPLAPVAGAA